MIKKRSETFEIAINRSWRNGVTYGVSIDYLVMPGIARDTKQSGAALIISHKDSSVDIEQIPLSSIE